MIDQPRVTIYCEGPDSRRHTREVFVTHERSRIGRTLGWIPLTFWVDGDRQERARDFGGHRALLRGKPVNPMKLWGQPAAAEVDAVFAQRCPDCGFNLIRRDIGGVWAAFNDVVSRGESTISLRELDSYSATRHD